MQQLLAAIYDDDDEHAQQQIATFFFEQTRPELSVLGNMFRCYSATMWEVRRRYKAAQALTENDLPLAQASGGNGVAGSRMNLILHKQKALQLHRGWMQPQGFFVCVFFFITCRAARGCRRS